MSTAHRRACGIFWMAAGSAAIQAASGGRRRRRTLVPPRARRRTASLPRLARSLRAAATLQGPRCHRSVRLAYSGPTWRGMMWRMRARRTARVRSSCLTTPTGSCLGAATRPAPSMAATAMLECTSAWLTLARTWSASARRHVRSGRHLRRPRPWRRRCSRRPAASASPPRFEAEPRLDRHAPPSWRLRARRTARGRSSCLTSTTGCCLWVTTWPAPSMAATALLEGASEWLLTARAWTVAARQHGTSGCHLRRLRPWRRKRRRRPAAMASPPPFVAVPRRDRHAPPCYSRRHKAGAVLA